LLRALADGGFVFRKFAAVLFLTLINIEVFALEIQGERQQGAVLRGKVVPDTQVEFEGKKIRVSKDGEFVIGLGRDAGEHVKLTVVDINGQRANHNFAVARREYKIQRITGVPQRTVTPSPEQIERSRREAKMAADARKADLPLQNFAEKFQWPLVGPITGVYGSQRFYNGEPNSPHYGIDIAAPTGTEVRAPAGGIVTLVHPDMFFSGGTLIVDHGHGLSSTFIHLHKILVKEGERVEQGQRIALVGASGRATGPHLDWRMNWFEERVDPALLVGPMPDPEPASKKK
jgi:murein DD-endopeptidase MepM/ murein hydrolase activator NlpD